MTSQVIECLQLSESTACCQKSRYDCIVALCIFLKKRIPYPYRCKDIVPLFERNPTDDLRLIFTLDLIYQRHRHRLESWKFQFLQLSYLQRYVDPVAGKGAHYITVLTLLMEQLLVFVYSHHTRVHGVKFQSVVLPNGLIISLEGQWEGQRHDCVLCL